MAFGKDRSWNSFKFVPLEVCSLGRKKMTTYIERSQDLRQVHLWCTHGLNYAVGEVTSKLSFLCKNQLHSKLPACCCMVIQMVSCVVIQSHFQLRFLYTTHLFPYFIMQWRLEEE